MRARITASVLTLVVFGMGPRCFRHKFSVPKSVAPQVRQGFVDAAIGAAILEQRGAHCSGDLERVQGHVSAKTMPSIKHVPLMAFVRRDTFGLAYLEFLRHRGRLIGIHVRNGTAKHQLADSVHYVDCGITPGLVTPAVGREIRGEIVAGALTSSIDNETTTLGVEAVSDIALTGRIERLRGVCNNLRGVEVVDDSSDSSNHKFAPNRLVSLKSVGVWCNFHGLVMSQLPAVECGDAISDDDRIVNNDKT
ncbi:hypothetical protein PG987_015655 [Apiospora arundinis]